MSKTKTKTWSGKRGAPFFVFAFLLFWLWTGHRREIREEASERWLPTVHVSSTRYYAGNVGFGSCLVYLGESYKEVLCITTVEWKLWRWIARDVLVCWTPSRFGLELSPAHDSPKNQKTHRKYANGFFPCSMSCHAMQCPPVVGICSSTMHTYLCTYLSK